MARRSRGVSAMPLVPSIPQTGSQLRIWRRHHRLTQGELGESLGVSASTIGRWERGDRPLKPRIRGLFPTPPLLTRKISHSHREPTKAELAMAMKASEAAAQTVNAFNASYVRSIADTVERVQRLIGGDAIARMVSSFASQVAPMPNVLASVDWSRVVAAQTGVSQLAANFEKSFRPLLDQIASVGQLIASAFPTDEEFERVSSTLADRGWFLGLVFPIGIVRKVDALLATDDGDGVESLMQDYVRRRLGHILRAAEERCPSRAAILESAMKAHEESKFELSVPVLLAQADGIAGEILGGHLFRRHNKTTVASRQLDDKLIELGITLDHGLVTVALAPVYDAASIGIHTEERDKRRTQDPLYGPLNRHGVLHGLDLDYGTEANSLRAFLLLEFLLSVEGVLSPEE